MILPNYGAGGIIKKQLNIKLQELCWARFNMIAKSKEKQTELNKSYQLVLFEGCWKPFRITIFWNSKFYYYVL
jgi:hypothetical protein